MRSSRDKNIRRLLKVMLIIIALSILTIKLRGSAMLDYQPWIIFICMSTALIIDFADHHHLSRSAFTHTFM